MMKIVIEPDARQLILDKGQGSFVLDMVSVRG